MRINFSGKVVDEPRIRAGFIGCGSHSFRNLYPVLQFAPVELVAVTDLDGERAKAFAAQFGARSSYTDYRIMLAKENLDAVFVCTNYDDAGRPRYPAIAADCLEAGTHVWIEKPPAASCADIERMQKAAGKAGRNVMAGLKKMFYPANEKAKELMQTPDFGNTELALIRYPQHIPLAGEYAKYRRREVDWSVVGFLDHLCHPASLLVYLLGMPKTLYFRRSTGGGGSATFTFATGAVATMAFTQGSSNNGGMEHTTIVSNQGKHITIENNLRVTLHRQGPLKYGEEPSFYAFGSDQASAVWEPEFSLGQLYNKSLFLQGYYGEMNEFALSILEKRAPAKGTLDHAWQVTRIFEAFFEGEGKEISLENR